MYFTKIYSDRANMMCTFFIEKVTLPFPFSKLFINICESEIIRNVSFYSETNIFFIRRVRFKI